MKILVIGDPHFRKDNLDTMGVLCSELLQIISDRRPDKVIILGDIEDTHERLFLKAHVDAITFFEKIAEMCPLVVLIGNHDRQNNSDFMTNIHPYVGLKSHPKITIVDTAMWDPTRKFLYVPYVPVGRFREALASAGYDCNNPQSDRPTYIFAHQEFAGCNIGGRSSAHGDVWSAALPHVISGHIHDYQQLPGVTYVGTPIQQNYGEKDDKAIILLDTNSGSTERIRCQSIPPRVTISLTAEQLPQWKDLIPDPARAMVRVLLHVDAIDVKPMRQSRAYIELKGAVNKVVEKITTSQASLASKILASKSESIENVVVGMLGEDYFAISVFREDVVGKILDHKI